MSSIEIALSADNEEDFRKLRWIFRVNEYPLTIRHQEPIDLLLREHVNHFSRQKAPGIIIASYRSFFTDLKVITELRKLAAYKSVHIIVILDQDVSRIKHKLLEFGISEVLEWKNGISVVESRLEALITDYMHTPLAS